MQNIFNKKSKMLWTEEQNKKNVQVADWLNITGYN